MAGTREWSKCRYKMIDMHGLVDISECEQVRRHAGVVRERKRRLPKVSERSQVYPHFAYETTL
jgi:hypothetical protein